MKKQAFFWLLFLSSCTLNGFDEAGRCTITEDCDPGLVCASNADPFASGFCVLDAPNPLTFAIDISPLPGQGVLRHQQIFTPDSLFTGDTPQALLGNFTLEQATLVSGLVAAIGVSQNSPASISATLVEDPLISGTGAETFFALSSDSGLFSFSVRPGLYNIIATSQDNALPPLVLKGVSLPLKQNEMLQLNLDASQKLRGVLTANGQPLEGIRVSARAEDDLLTLRSTIATTGPDGSFSLSLSPNETKLVFRYEPDADGPNSVIPVAEQLVVLSGLTTADGFIELGTFDVGPLEAPLELLGHVSGPNASLDSTADASDTTALTFTRIELPNSNRSFSRKVLVDSAGNYSVKLLSGSYQVSVQIPSANEFASGTLGVIDFLCVAEPCDAIDLTLTRRHKIFGQIQDTTGALLPEPFAVEARDANQPEGSPIQNVSSDPTLRSFEVLLDPGVYDLTFLPPTSGGLAQGLLFGVDVFTQDARADAIIPPPSLLIGQIAANENMGALPPPLATVRVFARSSAGDFYLLNVLTSDFFGNFAAIVPNPANSDVSLFSPLLP
jgi:hypothetical protein